ncbi:MAG TPA: hypothetical protein VFJ11_07655 [Gaiellaceae bacterium]|nr:hypothetical protein [Gaiellaceae bacterium]
MLAVALDRRRLLSWQDHRAGAQQDVHSLAWYSHSPGESLRFRNREAADG